MDPTLKQKIELLQQKGQQFQKESKYKESLDVYQELLQLIKNSYGFQSQQYQRISIKLCQLCNLISMILLQKQKFDLCLMFLKKGQSNCLKMPKFLAITYNNYACYYRKTGKHRSALMYLQKALELQWKQQKHQTLADTYLNLCAVLSQLGRHSQALENILYSIVILQEEILTQDPVNTERVPVLCIAHHNMGVELEFLKRFQQSIASYEKAVKLATKYLGDEHPLTQNLGNVLQSASQSKEIADKRIKKRDNQKVQKMKITYASRPKTSDPRELKQQRKKIQQRKHPSQYDI